MRGVTGETSGATITMRGVTGEVCGLAATGGHEYVVSIGESRMALGEITNGLIIFFSSYGILQYLLTKIINSVDM